MAWRYAVKNSYPVLMAYLALLQCGARLLPLNPTLPTAQLATLLPGLDIAFFSPDVLTALFASMISLALPSSNGAGSIRYLGCHSAWQR